MRTAGVNQREEHQREDLQDLRHELALAERFVTLLSVFYPQLGGIALKTRLKALSEARPLLPPNVPGTPSKMTSLSGDRAGRSQPRTPRGFGLIRTNRA